MSTKELKRWVVMRRIRDGTLSRGEAAVLLGLSYRQVKRLFRRFRTHGQQGDDPDLDLPPGWPY